MVLYISFLTEFPDFSRIYKVFQTHLNNKYTYFWNGLHLLLGLCNYHNTHTHTHKQTMIKHHSAFKNKGILIEKPKLPQKYILNGSALIHKKK